MSEPTRFRKLRLLAGPAALLGVAVIIFSVLMIASPQAKGQEALVSTNPQDIANGQTLFDEHCEACHGFQGQGGVVSGAPALVNVGAAAADFYLSSGRMPLNAPNNEPQQNRPAFSPQEIRYLVAYVNALPIITHTNKFGPSIPHVLPLCGNQTTPTTTRDDCVTLSEGSALYAVNCAQCHQAAGAGGMLSKGNVIPSLHSVSSLQEAAEAPLVGPKPMPNFSWLTNKQVSAIAHYVLYLKHPADPGGFGISHFGPVAEGFFGVFVGFAVLWFAVRMMGARR